IFFHRRFQVRSNSIRDRPGRKRSFSSFTSGRSGRSSLIPMPLGAQGGVDAYLYEHDMKMNHPIDAHDELGHDPLRYDDDDSISMVKRQRSHPFASSSK
ncbi:hypothetical protein PENTCL1PPCAC_21133, partial [Pristionchus entomophagus]